MKTDTDIKRGNRGWIVLGGGVAAREYRGAPPVIKIYYRGEMLRTYCGWGLRLGKVLSAKDKGLLTALARDAMEHEFGRN